MAWTTPMTAVANTPMTASLYNTYIRDNLNQCAPALAGTAGDVFVVQGANDIATVTPQFASVTTSESTTSTSYTDLSTSGPSVTFSSGVYGQQAMVWIACDIDNNTANAQSVATVEVTGASTYSASITRCAIVRDALAANSPCGMMATYLFDPISRNRSVTFTMKYRAGSGTATFANRRMFVWPL